MLRAGLLLAHGFDCFQMWQSRVRHSSLPRRMPASLSERRCPPVTPPESGVAARCCPRSSRSLPIPLLLVILPALWWFFRDTWKELDDDATRWRVESAAAGRTDYRPFVALAMCAVDPDAAGVLRRPHVLRRGHPPLARARSTRPIRRRSGSSSTTSSTASAGGHSRASAGTSCPFAVWKLFFPRGLAARHGPAHARLLQARVDLRRVPRRSSLPTLLVVSRQPDFGVVLPVLQGLLALLVRLPGLGGDVLRPVLRASRCSSAASGSGALRRSFGSGAIFAMAVPYCMIHFGKPFLEANGAIVAGIALGSLSMKTKSIYQGFFVHITVAGADGLAGSFAPPRAAHRLLAGGANSLRWVRGCKACRPRSSPPPPLFCRRALAVPPCAALRARAPRVARGPARGPAASRGVGRPRRRARWPSATRPTSWSAGSAALRARRGSICAPCGPIRSRPPSWAAPWPASPARPRALESLLWRHLAQAPWTTDSRDATRAVLDALRVLHEGPLKNAIRARALGNARDAL